MSEFAYTGKPLDELRALAESPQVGRMYEMQAGFQKIADHMDGVVSALGRLQADLPNWWTGAAANQAASAFAQVVSVAQRVHENADGAAAVLGRCAMVVSQQQTAMQDVPDVAEPGPVATGGALDPSAAQEATTYRAARERAVQVVNGIAAQYVETHAQFAAFAGNAGENFQAIAAATSGNRTAALPTSAAGMPMQAASQQTGMRPWTPDPHVRTTMQAALQPTGMQPVTPDPQLAGMQYRFADTWKPAISLVPASSPQSPPTPTTPRPNVWKPPPTPSTAGASEIDLIPLAAVGAMIPTGIAVAGRHGADSTFIPPTDENPPHTIPPSTKPQVRSANRAVQPDDPILTTSGKGVSHDGAIEEDQIRSLYLQPMNCESAMYNAPGSTSGYAHSANSRKKRPSYVKEPKNAWLSDETAAPPDGILTPGWADPE